MEKVLFIVAVLLVSSSALAGRTYDSDADDQFLPPIQAYDEIRGKCYLDKLQDDDPDPVQYVEIIFRNHPDHGGLSFAIGSPHPARYYLCPTRPIQC
jgi:hypothetical protein